MNPLPVEYHLEVYERSFLNDPAISITTHSPLPSFAIGDYFSHRSGSELTWTNPPVARV
jgi:hypothetical protein